jgi:DNA ligase D-like protein (predicted 3'-phosphoesterase)
MPLEKYRAKRDFTKSPEPAGTPKSRPTGTARAFCVQKHLASHLHYDFRLEHDGVLLSWAVPKGPALDPSIKRLAMHVEDHPIEYGDFEGVIPSGYGAGIVMLWDRGTWTPEVDDIDAALKKGDLKFTLNGFKLKGSWVLVRTGGGRFGRSGGDTRSWLLIKHRDEWAGDLDIAEFAPLSVKSGGDLADILAQEQPDIWRSNRPATGGEAGEMFAKIIARALALREARDAGSAVPAEPGLRTPGTTTRKTTRRAGPPKKTRQSSKETRQAERRADASKATRQSVRRAGSPKETHQAERRADASKATRQSVRRAGSPKETHQAERRADASKATRQSVRRAGPPKETRRSSKGTRRATTSRGRR